MGPPRTGRRPGISAAPPGDRMSFKRDALDYHSEGRPGKIEVVPTKPLLTQRDLSLAYTPGVAEPCLAIKNRPDDVYRYTVFLY